MIVLLMDIYFQNCFEKVVQIWGRRFIYEERILFRGGEVSAPDYQGLKLDKVIFLDIDGVLNDEGANYRKGVKVERGMVRCLGKIVNETGAEVILTSSWRLDYLRFVEADYTTEDKEIKDLDGLLSEFNISIRGIVPITSWSGPSSRPAEICEWLDVEKAIRILNGDEKIKPGSK